MVVKEYIFFFKGLVKGGGGGGLVSLDLCDCEADAV